MKKLIYFLFVLCLFSACSGDDPEPMQDYTSFTLTWIGGNSDIFTNYKTGYFNEDGKCILLFEIGQLKESVETKEYIMPEFHHEIYLFYDLIDYIGGRMEKPFLLEKNKKNILITPKDARGITIIEKNEYNWPH